MESEVIEFSIIEDTTSVSCRSGFNPDNSLERRSGFSPTCRVKTQPTVNHMLSRIMKISIIESNTGETRNNMKKPYAQPALRLISKEM